MLYGALSTLAVSIVIFNAFQSYSNFYAVAVHLSRSNRSVMVSAAAHCLVIRLTAFVI